MQRREDIKRYTYAQLLLVYKTEIVNARQRQKRRKTSARERECYSRKREGRNSSVEKRDTVIDKYRVTDTAGTKERTCSRYIGTWKGSESVGTAVPEGILIERHIYAR